MKNNNFVNPVAFALIVFLSLPSAFGNLNKTSKTKTDTTTTSSQTTSDEISSPQSSTTTSDCINVSGQGKLCGERAWTYCNNNVDSTECRNFNKAEKSKSDGSSSSESSY